MKKYINKFPEGKLIDHLFNNREDISRFANKDFFEEEFKYFTDFDKFVKIVDEIKDTNGKLAILTDFDSDGTNSCTILAKAFTDLGVVNEYYIEERSAGYGMQKDTIKRMFDSGCGYLITADFGIKNFDEVQYAKDLGMTVIITDHHTAGETLPNADVVINPVIEDDSCRFGKLCGAGVVYKLMKDLYETYEIPFDTTLELIHFASIGTIGDLVSLKCEYNYLLVKKGLETLHETQNAPLDMLLRLSMGNVIQKVESSNLSYGVVPIINSMSRLGHNQKFVDYFLKTDSADTFDFASKAIALNNKRKDIQRSAQRVAAKLVVEQGLNKDDIIVVQLDTEKGVCGLVASYLTEMFERPSLVCTEINGMLVGSARSVGTFSIYDAMMDSNDLFLKWGGHPMAAGFSLPIENLEKLREGLNAYVGKNPVEDYDVTVEAELKIAWVGEQLMDVLDKVEPTGMHNEKPLFTFNDVVIRDMRIQNGHSFLTLEDPNDGNYWGSRNMIKAVRFFRELDYLEIGDSVDIICCVQNAESLIIDRIVERD